jgi:hypothetical protein
MTVDLSRLRPPWKRQRVFGIDCSRSWRQADSMLIGRWTARSMRPPKRFVHSRPISMSRQQGCASRSKRSRAVPHPTSRRIVAFLLLGYLGSCAGISADDRPTDGATPSMLVPSSCRLGKSSIFLGRIVSSMFMRVNSKCAHQVRPPLADLDGCRSPVAPTVVALIKKRNTPENGRHDVAKVAPDQAKTSGSLRAIADTEPLHTLHRRATRSARRAFVQSSRSASTG